ncbi:hypothetical protein T02_1348 [Trichinella nativa]|uniref:Integrase catalytic domain-containing protein n=1 Tax=Trichinella nativa TaxID=6335 RepID=A0A0V1LHH5_9BILA|nr:hypothetical protein T02_1348 [Trichinella nativa]
MDPTRDTTSDRTSSTNDSSRTMTSQRSRTRTYDSEGSALKYWIDQLQELCTGPTYVEAICQVTGTLRHTTQLFFDSRQRHLDSMPEEERDAAIIEFDELIDKLKTIQRQAHHLLAAAEIPSSAEITQPTATKNNNPKTNSTRPIPKLPTFDGDILQFKAFWDQFNAAVHRRDDLEDVTKFVHLRSCLAGPALHAISDVTTAAENYPAVVQLLHDRFYRVSDVLDVHILKIFSVTKEASKGKEGLLALHEKLNGHLLELRAIGTDLDTTVCGFRMALPQLVAQLPKNIQFRWKDQCGKLTEEPTSHTFLDSLAEQARCAVDPAQSTQGERISSPTHKHTLSENRRKRPRSQRQTIGAFHTSLHPICSVCQGKYCVTVCPRFLNQQQLERKATAVRFGLCFICLSQGHTSQRCMMRQRGWRTHHLLTETAPNRRTPQPKPSDTSITPPAKKTRSEPSEETSTRLLLANTRGSARIRGAETTLVTEEVARALNLVGTSETVTVKGIGGIQCAPTVARRSIEALTLPRICDDIHSVPVRCDEWKHLQHLQLPEEEDEKLPIHVLIGVDSYGQFLGEKILRGNPTDPVAIETTLGWVVFGPVNPPRPHGTDTEKFLGTRIHRHPAPRRQNGSRRVQLPDNYTLAECRLRSVERSLMKDPVKQREYSAVINEYLRQGWAEEVTTQTGQPGKSWYLPHHAVYKNTDGQLKSWIVFDGSAKYAGVSLNDNLETGPNLQTDLVGILLRFRQYRIAVQADIEKMYLQVGLRIDDRDACRFLWRDCKTDTPPRRYRLTRVCFGLACSPYLALNVLKAHAELNPGENNQTVKLALSNMYVDDLVVSCDGEAEVRDLIHRVPVFLRKGGFHLKRWTCNQAALLDTLPREEVSEHGKRELGKTLGIYWGKDEDTLTFQPPANSTARFHHTKRQMLSLAARMYDPLGYIAPFTGQIKVLPQSLWTAGIDWDTPLSPGVERRWRDWMEQLEMLPKIRIPRAWIPYPVNLVRRIELHIFGDASQTAYAACAYIRVEPMDLVISKNRVAPLKQISLPRLELMAALLCARLKGYLEKELTLPIQETFCWSDSRVALAWIKECWRNCPTKENPADIPNRGCSLETLINSALWWHGPQWLIQSRENWPEETEATTDDHQHVVAEQRAVNRYETLIRVTAYCLRFARNCQSPAGERTTDVNLSVKELWNAETIWLREIQVTEFGTKPNSSERAIYSASRIQAPNHPAKQSPGRRTANQGPSRQAEACWCQSNIGSHQNKILHHQSQKRSKEDNPFIPADRVTESPPFSHTGVDFAGPLFVLPEGQGRNARVNKAYVCIFTCMTTRAVHLELLREQTTDNFLQGLRRFISRRGRPRVIQSDKFRSFKLADKFIRCLFRDSDWEKLQRKLNEERIRWKFITPRALRCGGYWERLIQCEYRKTIRGALLKYDELHTVLCEIEARINDRPLVFMGDDIGGEAALTPAHFLIGRELSRLPSVSTGAYRRDDTPSGVNHLIKRWRHQQRLTTQLWKRRKQEYITILATRGRWRKTGQEPKVGDIVLVHEPSTTWIKWPIGRIIEIHPSEDGVIRSATVKTRQGTVTRSARSLRLVEPSGDA